ncbi:glycosyl hydrolase, partial [Flavobacterium circumlabens]
VNPNYKTINVADQLEDEHSVLNYYKRLIQLKKDYDVFNYGKYELVDKDHKQIYSYKRILDNEEVIIMSNLTGEKATITYPLNIEKSKLLLHNYITIEDTNELEPFETRVYRIEG